jgi:hypothetical protein
MFPAWRRMLVLKTGVVMTPLFSFIVRRESGYAFIGAGVRIG